jgi:peptidoglycan hydrolase CwlO-like protein
MEQVFLTKEEVEKLKDLQTQEVNLINQLGQLEYQVQTLSLQKDNLKQQISILQKESTVIGKQLQDKYGEGTIDVSSGEFTKSS